MSKERKISRIYDETGRVTNPDIAHDMALAENRFRNVPIIGGLLTKLTHNRIEGKVERGKKISEDDLPEDIKDYLAKNYSHPFQQAGRFKTEEVRKIDYGNGKEAYILKGILTVENYSSRGTNNTGFDGIGKEYHSQSYPQTLRYETQDGKLKKNKKTVGIATLAVMGFLVGLLFLSNNMTGNVIGNSGTTDNVIGIIFFLIGLIGSFIYFKRR